MDKLFLKLLQSALWGIPVHLDDVPEATDWRTVYDMAVRHAVQGLIYDVIKSLPSGYGIPLSLAAEWMVVAESLERNYEKHKLLTDSMRNFFAENGVTAVQMKGISTSAFYAEPQHRVLGDIDWWLPGEENWQRALELVMKKGFSVTMDSDGDCHYTVDGIVVEHHRKGLAQDGPVGVLLLLNGHILHHVAVTGIGMRHLCDIAASYSALAGKYDAEEYAGKLREQGLLRWTALLHSVLAHSLDVPAQILPDLGKSYGVSDRDVHRMERLILNDGNFGLNKERRYSGLAARTAVLLKYAPWQFLRRWLGLIYGRMTR